MRPKTQPILAIASRRVVSRLDQHTMSALRDALEPQWTIHNTVDVNALLRTAPGGGYDVAILDALDPAVVDAGEPGSLRGFRLVYRSLSLPVVLVSPPSCAALDFVIRIARCAPISLILRLKDDVLEGAELAVTRAISAKVSFRVLQVLQRENTRPLSTMANYALEQLFCEPSAFAREERALASLGTSSDFVNSEFKAAGLAPFHVLRRIARVSHAYQLIAEFGLSVKEAAVRTGAGSVDSLTRETKKLAGMTPRLVSRNLGIDELVETGTRAARLVR